MEGKERYESDKGTPQRRINITNISEYIFTLCTRLMVWAIHQDKEQGRSIYDKICRWWSMVLWK